MKSLLSISLAIFTIVHNLFCMETDGIGFKAIQFYLERPSEKSTEAIAESRSITITDNDRIQIRSNFQVNEDYANLFCKIFTPKGSDAASRMRNKKEQSGGIPTQQVFDIDMRSFEDHIIDLHKKRHEKMGSSKKDFNFDEFAQNADARFQTLISNDEKQTRISLLNQNEQLRNGLKNRFLYGWGLGAIMGIFTFKIFSPYFAKNK